MKRIITLLIICIAIWGLYGQDDAETIKSTPLTMSAPDSSKTVDTLDVKNINQASSDESNPEPKTVQEAFNLGNEMYQCGNFAQAADYYSMALSMGMITPTVFYNLGNAHFKNDNIAHAILAYERAHFLDPRDKDIDKNLNYARDFTTDKINSMYDNSFVGLLWDTIRQITYRETIILFVASSAIATLLLFLYLTSVLAKKKFLRMVLRLSIFFWIIAIVGVGIYVAKNNDIWKTGGAIIMAENVDITSAPTSDGELLFSLNPGTKVAIKDEMGNHYRIMILDGREGWLPKSTVLKILPTSI